MSRGRRHRPSRAAGAPSRDFGVRQNKSQSGPVSRILFRLSAAATIYLGRRLLAGSSALPAARNDAGRVWLPIWTCWRWGFPCRSPRGGRGALLPHLFTLACEPRHRSVTCDDRWAKPSAVYFLWHYPWHHCRWPLAITVPCPVRTFLPIGLSADRAAA